MSSCDQCCAKPRRRGVIGWLLPVVTLFVLPKCPLCVAAYAAWLGVGVSVSTAAWLRSGIQVACVIALAFLFVQLAVRLARKR